MVELSPGQSRSVEWILRLAGGGSQHLRTILLVGPEGSGKRTLARTAASTLGLTFIEVPVNAAPRSVWMRLAGSQLEAERARQELKAPGSLGQAEPSCLYVSGVQHLDPALWSDIERVVSERRYFDLVGNTWQLSDDVWIVGGLTFPVHEPAIVPDHWLARAFDHQINIQLPTADADLRHVCVGILEELGHMAGLDSDATTMLRAACLDRRGLHTIRRWITEAARIASAAPISSAILRLVGLNDVRWLLSQAPYRGMIISATALGRWLAQFPDDIQPLALHLVRSMTQRYYVGSASFHGGLNTLIRKSNIPKGSRVSFCRWQSMGQSAPRLAHALKNQAGWRADVEIDLEHEARWPAGEIEWIIIADDFVGSGNRLSSISEGPRSRLDALLSRYPRAQVMILILVAYAHGLRRIRAMSRRERVRMLTYRVLGDEDRVFTEASTIIPNSHDRQALRQFCMEEATNGRLSGLPPQFWLGYRETGAIVVFFDTVPNNSLPILWADNGRWVPLFPVAGLP